MLICPNIVINSIKETLNVFVQNVLPSLFVFILCSQMILMLNGAKIIGYPLLIITRLLKLDDCTAGAYAASLIGGYPSGAASLNLLYDQGQIKRRYLISMLLCSNCGPMFMIGTIGTAMLRSYGAGIVILLSHIVGGVINAWLISLLIRNKKIDAEITRQRIKVKKDYDLFKILDKCIINTSKIMLKIFAFMGLFKLIGDAIFAGGVDSNDELYMLEVFFRGTLELLDGCIAASKLDFYHAATAICVIVSFGGLSAVFQSISVSKEIPFNKIIFMLGKAGHGIISGMLCYVFIRLVPYTVTTYAQQGQNILNLQMPVNGFVFVCIGVCIMYTLLRKRLA